MEFNACEFRAQFPALDTDNIYLDSASTALKPTSMIKATLDYYSHDTATILRGQHKQALALTEQADQARKLTANLINAKQTHEIIWTKSATESINLIAQSYAKYCLDRDDEIIISELEHHSNLVPWLQIAQEIGIKIVKWQTEDDGSLSTERLLSLITNKTRIIAVTQMSNVTGYQPEIQKIASIAHQHQAIIVVDGAQGIVHHAIDVQKLNIDFYVFSAHKLYGPTGLGILYGKSTLLEKMTCWQGGGKMLKSASFLGFEPADLPYKFEAGTPNLAAIVGFGAVLTWLNSFQADSLTLYTHQLAQYCRSQLALLPSLTIKSEINSPLLTFTSDTIYYEDLAILLAEQNIAIRAGKLCAQPLIKSLKCAGVIRASFMPYNDQHDADCLINALQNALDILK